MVYYDLAADQRIWQYKIDAKNKKFWEALKWKIKNFEETDLNEIIMVWEETIKILFEHKIYDKESLQKWTKIFDIKKFVKMNKIFDK